MKFEKGLFYVVEIIIKGERRTDWFYEASYESTIEVLSCYEKEELLSNVIIYAIIDQVQIKVINEYELLKYLKRKLCERDKAEKERVAKIEKEKEMLDYLKSNKLTKIEIKG